MHFGFEKNTRDILLKNQGEEPIMNINQVKEEAKKRFDKDLTDEQAQAWLEAHPAGELSEEDLNQVTGGVFKDALLPPIIKDVRKSK